MPPLPALPFQLVKIPFSQDQIFNRTMSRMLLSPSLISGKTLVRMLLSPALIVNKVLVRMLLRVSLILVDQCFEYH